MVGNVDVTVILETPKIRDHVDAMRAAVAARARHRRRRASASRARPTKASTPSAAARRSPRTRSRCCDRRAMSHEPRAMSHCHESPIRPEPDRPAARRQRAHGAVQLAARARRRRHVHPAHRGHRRRAIDARVGGGDPARPALARPRLGRGARRRRRARAVSPVRAAAPLSVVREGAARPPDAAYYCFCSTAQLEAERQAALAAGRPARYAGTCRRLSREQAAARIAAGERPAIRFRVPEERDVVFTDAVRGDVRFQTDVIGDPVIVRADGTPAYNFAVVVDDALMEVTHVVRGEDHISNTPRQILLYEALGFTPPVVRAPVARDGAGSQPAVEASRRDVGRRVPREGLSARGAGELPRADRLVARRRRRAAADRRAGAALLARGRRPQRRRVRRGEARVGEPPLSEDGGPGAARGAVAAVLQRGRRAR